MDEGDGDGGRAQGWSRIEASEDPSGAVVTDPVVAFVSLLDLVPKERRGAIVARLRRSWDAITDLCEWASDVAHLGAMATEDYADGDSLVGSLERRVAASDDNARFRAEQNL